MIYFLLAVAALTGYLFGSISVRRIASQFVFRRNLNKFGRGNAFLTGFRREYGWQGFLKYFLIEAFMDLIPIFIGGLLLKSKDLESVGRVFTLFCVIMGKQWPIMYRFRGQTALFCIILGTMTVSIAGGIVLLLIVIAILYFGKYVSTLTPSAGFLLLLVSYFLLDDPMISKLCWCIFGIVAVASVIPVLNCIAGNEERFNLKDDIAHKFDRSF